jgi:hypothetical protein
LAVPGAVEPVPGRVAGRHRAWGEAIECGEGSLRADAAVVGVGADNDGLRARSRRRIEAPAPVLR